MAGVIKDHALVRRWAVRRWVSLLAVLLIAPAWAADPQTGGTLGSGTPWETNYYVRTSDRAGPTVVITGGIHGDEPAGAAAAEQIRHWPIECGTLVVLPAQIRPLWPLGRGRFPRSTSRETI